MKTNLCRRVKKGMKSILLLVSAIIFAGLTFAQAPSAILGRPSVAPVVDGTIDQVWTTIQAQPIALPYRQEVPTLGLEGETYWKGLWSTEGIYILVNVTDNVFSPAYAGSSPLTNWMYDKVELYFDCNSVKKDGLGAAHMQGHYCYAPPPHADYVNGGQPLQNLPTGSLYAYKVTGPSYVVEYFIPFKELLNKDQLEVDKSAPIGFDITIIDNDVKSPMRNRMVWANNGAKDESWDNMDDAGQIVLTGCACPSDTVVQNDHWSNHNLIRNWDFTSDLTHWDGWYDTDVPGQIVPEIENGEVKMTSGEANNGEFWHYQFNQVGLQAEANVPYILKFKSWSNIPRTNRVDFEDLPENGFTRYGASTDAEALNGRSEWEYYTTAEPQWFTFHVIFDQIKPTTVQKIQWMLSNAVATTYLDSILLMKEEDINNSSFLAVSTSDITMNTGMESNGMFDITSNTGWEISSDQPWVSFNPSTGTGNRSINFTVQANPTYSKREAIIIISATGVLSKTFKIIQPARPQTSKTLTVTAGKLSSLMSAEELATTTGLTLKGTIDARDFKTMRDQMPMLTEVDISAVTIDSYSGTGGTVGTNVIIYPANSIPDNAFRTPSGLGKHSLKTIKLPSSLSMIGKEAFTFCTGITSMTIPAPVTEIKPYAFSSCSALTSVILPPSTSVYKIGAYAFQNCSSLLSLNIPFNVSYIGEFAFNNCSALINVDNGNTLYSSLDGILYNRNKTKLISCPTSKAGKLIIPSTVISIESSAFSFCRMLTSLTIPASVTSISHYVFSQCTELDTLYALSPVPVNLSTSTAVFSGVNEPPAYLYVPYGSKQLYAAADQWKDFTIIEISGLSIAFHALTLDAAAGSQSTVQLYCDTTWTATSSQQWLTVSPTNGLGNGTLTFTAQANPLSTPRTAQITVSASGIEAQTITITQQGQPLTSKTLNLTAGELSSLLTTNELFSITRLSLTGTIDARDFKTMRDQMPLLEVVDISAVTIAEYTGTGGTCGFNNYTYPANVLPDNAFRTPSGLGKSTLKAINLPLTITSIGKEAFLFCHGLTSLLLPEGVTTIRNQAFASCKSLTSIIIPSTLTLIEAGVFQNCYSLLSVTIPSSITSIGEFAFNNCNALIIVEEANSTYSSQDGILFNKAKTSLISCPTSKAGGYTIPSSVKLIESSAFGFCDKLTSLTIPASVTSISHYAFSQCKNLSAVNVLSPAPVNLSSSTAVFFGIDQATTILCVPFGSKALYAAAEQWKDFKTIVEVYGFTLSSYVLELNASGESVATVQLFCDSTWTASSYQDWLTVNQSDGIGSGTLTISAEYNPLNTFRQAVIAVYSPGKKEQTITVTQSPATGVNQLSDEQQWTLYPNPTSGKVKLTFGKVPQKETYLTVVDVTGRVVLKQLVQNKEENIDLSGNPRGNYFVKTSLNDGKVQRIVLK